MRRILSIDGGGIRGIIPACALVELEKQTGRLTRDWFSMAAGTSTGALIAVAVAAGVPAADILKVYTAQSARIFKAFCPTLGMLLDGHKYDTDQIAQVLQETLSPVRAAAWRLNDSPIRLLLTARGVNRKAWYFTQDTPHNPGLTGRLGLIECATASAAAPIYFHFYYVHPLGGGLVGYCADGGVGTTGNPVYQACVEAFFYDDFKPDPLQTRVVSLGTGYYPCSDVNPPAGLIATLLWTLDTMIDAPHDEQTRAVDRHWPGVMKRFDWELPRVIDMASTSDIPELVKIGEAAARGMDWNAILA